MDAANGYLTAGISAEIEHNYEAAKDLYRAAAERFMDIAKKTDRENNKKDYESLCRR